MLVSAKSAEFWTGDETVKRRAAERRWGTTRDRCARAADASAELTNEASRSMRRTRSRRERPVGAGESASLATTSTRSCMGAPEERARRGETRESRAPSCRVAALPFSVSASLLRCVDIALNASR